MFQNDPAVERLVIQAAPTLDGQKKKRFLPGDPVRATFKVLVRDHKKVEDAIAPRPSSRALAGILIDRTLKQEPIPYLVAVWVTTDEAPSLDTKNPGLCTPFIRDLQATERLEHPSRSFLWVGPVPVSPFYDDKKRLKVVNLQFTKEFMEALELRLGLLSEDRGLLPSFTPGVKPGCLRVCPAARSIQFWIAL